jgi:hypothetical protein
LITVAAVFRKSFALLIIFIDAGLFILGGLNGPPECGRLLFEMGSRKKDDAGCDTIYDLKNRFSYHDQEDLKRRGFRNFNTRAGLLL